MLDARAAAEVRGYWAALGFWDSERPALPYVLLLLHTVMTMSNLLERCILLRILGVSRVQIGVELDAAPVAI